MQDYCILIFLCGFYMSTSINGLPSSISSDPCAGTTCGIGAQCEKDRNLGFVVCICPDDTIGDPFEKCENISGSDVPIDDGHKNVSNTITPPTTTATTSTTTTETPTTIQIHEQSTDTSTTITSNSSTTDIQNLPSDDLNLHTSTNTNSTTTIIIPLFDANAAAAAAKRKEDEIMMSQFASAPPTLSHYAHSHTKPQHFIPLEVNAPNSIHFVSQPNLKILNLTTTTTAKSPGVSTSGSTITESPSSSTPTSYYQQLTALYSGSRTRTRPQPPQRQPQHEHDQQRNSNNNGNHHHHHDQVNYKPYIHHHHRHPQVGSIQQHQEYDLIYPQQQQKQNSYQVTGPSSFNQMDNNLNFQTNQLNSYFKDPLGKYNDCRTVNNVIVCAETSDDSNSGPDKNFIRPTLPQLSSSRIFNKQQLYKPEQTRIPTMRPKPMRIVYEDSSLEIGSEPVFNSYRLDGPYGHPPTEWNTDPSYNNNNNNNENIFIKSKKPHVVKNLDEELLCKTLCGIDSVCRVLMGRPICGCPEGHSGDPSIKCIPIRNTIFDKNSCQRRTDCPPSLDCLNSQCIDPCNYVDTKNPHLKSDLCGTNANCTIIHHIPLCACQEGYDGNPYAGCVLVI